jgi:hypothetical protein
MSDKLVPYALRGRSNRMLHLGEEEEVVGSVTDKEFKLLFGFVPAIDIKLTPQQNDKLTLYIKRRDGRR